MAQIFQPELTDSFEIKSVTISQSDNVMKTVQEIYNYGVSNNYGNCFILYDNADNFLQNKGGYQIRYFYLTSLLTPRKIYLGSSNYLYNNGAIAGGRKIQHAIGVAVRMRSGEYETIDVATFSTNGNSYSTIVNTSGNFTTSTGGLYGATVYVNEDDYGSDYYTSYYGSGLHSGYDEVIYIDPSIYDELYIDGQLVPKANATIRVNYYLPDDDYEYARITYKKNEKPESVNDGTIVPISPNDSYVDIPKFVEGQSYWFKIFTNKSESEAFGYTVGEAPIPPEPEIGYVLFKDGNSKYPTIFTIQNPYVVSSGLTETGHCNMDIQNKCIHFHLDKTGNPYQESDAHYYVMFNGNNTKLSYTKSPYTISNTTYAKRFINTLKATVSGSASIKASWTGSGTGNVPILSSTIAISNSREISGVTNSRYLCIIRPDNIDETKTWNLDNAEIELQYVDEQVANGGSLYPPALSFSIDATNKFNYSTLDTEHIDLYVNNIILKLDKHLRPYKDDTFLIYSEDDAASNEWTIEQLMNEVKKINFNSFILRPIWNSAFTVLPFNLPGGNQLITKRDKYIGSGIGTNSTIAIENAFDNVNSLPTYLSLNTSSHQLKRSTNKYSDPSLADIPIISNYNTKYPNPASIGSNSTIPGCVLYTDAQYDEYYVNDMLIY